MSPCIFVPRSELLVVRKLCENKGPRQGDFPLIFPQEAISESRKWPQARKREAACGGFSSVLAH
eukprot:5606813-Lingulodinium_polyedra.AAC.1